MTWFVSEVPEGMEGWNRCIGCGGGTFKGDWVYDNPCEQALYCVPCAEQYLNETPPKDET